MVSSRGSSLSSRDQTQKARSKRIGVLACRSSFPSAMQAMPLAAIPLTALIPPRVGNRRNHIPKTLESPLIFLHSRGLPTLLVVAASALGWDPQLFKDLGFISLCHFFLLCSSRELVPSSRCFLLLPLRCSFPSVAASGRPMRPLPRRTLPLSW